MVSETLLPAISLPPAATSAIQILYSPPQTNRTFSILYPNEPQLGFQLLSLFPSLSPLPFYRPTPNCNGPTFSFDWPRSVLYSPLPISVWLLLCFSVLCGQGVHQRGVAFSMFWFCVCRVKTFASISLLALFFEKIYLLISFWQGNFCPGYSRVSYLKPSTDLKPITTSVTSSCRIMLSYRATRTFLCDPELYSQPLFRIGNIGFNHHSKSLGLKKTDFHWSLFNPSSPFPLNLKFHQVLTNDFKDPLHENRRWKKSGIMIPPPRSGDSRHFFKSSSLLRLFIEPFLLLLFFSIFRDLPIEFTRLQKKGIMIPHQTSGDYPTFSKLCSSILMVFELKSIPEFIYIYQDIQPFVPMSSLRFASTNTEVQDSFSTSFYHCLIVTIS